MTQAASGADGIDREVLAAVMAAVQSFLEEEEGLSIAAPDNRVSEWRLVVRAHDQRLTFGSSGAWRGAA